MARELSDREKRLTQLGYKALALAYKGQHRGARWVAHMAGKAGRLFGLSIEEWKARFNFEARVDLATRRGTRLFHRCNSNCRKALMSPNAEAMGRAAAGREGPR